MKSNLETITETLYTLINKIREDKININFIQVGSHDCETYEDLPSSYINLNDSGHYVEPVYDTFKKLEINRLKYKNCKFHNIAIVPNENFYSEYFHVHNNGCQSSFIKGIYYDDKPETDDWTPIKVDTVSVKKFIEENSIQTPDIYFVSTQGYDNDIIKEIINIHKPKIFFSESWDMSQVNFVISSNMTETPKSVKFTTRDELIELLNSNGYKCYYEDKKDRLLAWNLNYTPTPTQIVSKTKNKNFIIDDSKYISYSLFGTDLKYYVGAEKNIIINNRLLPDWDTVIYYHPENFRTEYLDKLLDLGAIMVDVSDLKLGNRPSLDFPFFWRFLPFLTNSMCLSRDLDSRLSKREVEYIRNWEKSDKDYLVIRDHPWHSPYPSGLFGIRRKIYDFEIHLNQYISSTNLVWGTDQDILEKYMSEKNKKEILYFGFDNLDTYIPRDDIDFFIGMQLDEFDNPTVPSGLKCVEFLNELNLPNNFKKTFKYHITTLAINEPYFEKSITFYTKLHDRTKNCILNITTTKSDLERLETHTGLTIDKFKERYPKINLNTLEDFEFRFEFPLEMNGTGFIFNLNLKVLAIKSCLKNKQSFDYLVYIDGDWGIHDGFDEVKFYELFETMEKNSIDFAFERPARIGDGRLNPSQTFYADKFYDYDCLENPLWDNAHVTNEQFLVFKNNWKLTLFEQKWEQMLWYTIANNIRNYPDGFEIGVCALESGMKWNYNLFPILKDCFYFYAKYSDIKHIKF